MKMTIQIEPGKGETAADAILRAWEMVTASVGTSRSLEAVNPPDAEASRSLEEALARSQLRELSPLVEPSMGEILAVTKLVIDNPKLGLASVQAVLAGYGAQKISTLSLDDKTRFVASLRELLAAAQRPVGA